MDDANTRQKRKDLLQNWQQYARHFFDADMLPEPVHLDRISADPALLEAPNAPVQVKRWKSQVKELLELSDSGKSETFAADPTAYCGVQISRYGILKKWHALVEKQYPTEEIPTVEQLWKVARGFPRVLKEGLEDEPKVVGNWAPQLRKLLELRDAKENDEIRELMSALTSRSGSSESISAHSGVAPKNLNLDSAKIVSSVLNDSVSTSSTMEEHESTMPAISEDSKNSANEGTISQRLGSDNRVIGGQKYQIPSGEQTSKGKMTDHEETLSVGAVSASSVENTEPVNMDSGKATEEESSNKTLESLQESLRSIHPRPEDVRSYECTDFRSAATLDDPEPIEGASLTDSVQEDGTVLLEWDLPDGDNNTVRLFRVVNDECDLPRDPEEGYLKCVTVGNSWLDTESHNSALTMYQVWVHEGKTEKEALLSEPQLVGETFLIHPVKNFSLSAIGQEITGQWDFAEKTHRVSVYSCTDNRNVLHPRNEICAGPSNLRGFRWQCTQGGVVHRFVVVRFVKVKGELIASKPSEEKQIRVDAELSAIDISVDKVDGTDSTEFNVSWEQPSTGEVRIYRTQKELPPDIFLLDSIALTGLQRVLADQDWQNNIEGTESSCTVAWPRDWYSIVLTPVHVDGNICRVGKSYGSKRVGEASKIELHERVTHQLLTFGWPQGASRVSAFYQEHPDDCGGDLPEPTPLATIQKEEYDKRGGMVLDPPLPARGTVVLEPAVTYERRLVKGTPGKVAYCGCLRMEYDIVPIPEQPGMIRINIYTNRDIVEENWHFTLLIQRHRIPLEKADGERVAVTRWKDRRPEGRPQQGLFTTTLVSREREQPTFWTFNLEALREYDSHSLLRVFSDNLLDSKGQNVSLVDPPVRNLHLGWLRHQVEQMKNSRGK